MLRISTNVVRRLSLAILASVLLLSGWQYLPEVLRYLVLFRMGSKLLRPSNDKRATTASTNWPMALLMAYALSRALLEYARFVLLLLSNEDAVQACYQQQCSADQMMKRELSRDQKQKGDVSEAVEYNPKPQDEHPTDEHETKCQGSHAQYKELQPSDHISTNILRTPSQLSTDSELKKGKHAGNGEQSSSATMPEAGSICGCEEEDFLVAREDDICKPGATAAVSKPAERATRDSAPKPVQASSSADGHSREEGGQTAQSDVDHPFASLDGERAQLPLCRVRTGPLTSRQSIPPQTKTHRMKPCITSETTFCPSPRSPRWMPSDCRASRTGGNLVHNSANPKDETLTNAGGKEILSGSGITFEHDKNISIESLMRTNCRNCIQGSNPSSDMT